MHLVHFPKELNLDSGGVYPAGSVLMEDRNAAEMMLMFEGHGISMSPYSYNPANPSQKRSAVLVAGTLGFGDAIMLTPVLRQLKQTGLEVIVSCPLHFRAALLNLPYVDGFENWPLKPETVEQYQRVHFLEGFHTDPLGRDLHMSEVFAAKCGVKMDDPKCDYIPTEEELEWAKKEFPRYEGRKRIGIQVQASHRCRTYHGPQLRKVMELLLNSGWELYMMGRQGEFGCVEIGHIHDASKHAPMFRQQAAFLTTCDAFLGPDSGFLHVAGALGIPSVGLFSVFPWKLRTAQYLSVFSIQANGSCGPCFHTRNKVQPHFPENHCRQAGHCTLLASIEPERVVQKILQMIDRQ